MNGRAGLDERPGAMYLCTSGDAHTMHCMVVKEEDCFVHVSTRQPACLPQYLLGKR